MFNFVVPFVPGTAQLRAVEDATQRVLARWRSAPTPPLVSDVQLPGAPDPVDGIVTVTWNASDGDGDDLPSTSSPAATAAPAIGRSISASPAPASRSIPSILGGGPTTLRVVASDGVHTAYAESATFTVRDRAPKVIITSPADGSHVD